ncbi:hypothetical protein B0T18DRAFT_389145 [Schizothecium vesticola]|uniref:Uncharacterized protein n=1 Tax=Schizothecium vesticola TaxID=314040 RepID=A0AA40F1N3_9PEZI|nr:hypothetical protein B0T18DRAFT_389145 [Schizothecium vesticola]
MSYANGADSLGNATSTSPENRLGGDGSGPFKMTAVEIAVICIVFAIFSAIVSLVIYCRVLHQRREADWDNQRRERKRRAQAFFGSLPGGQGIELADSSGGGGSKDVAGNPSTSVERLFNIPLPGTSSGGGVSPKMIGKGNDGGGSADLEAAVQGNAYIQRKSIWKYVHWRDQSTTVRQRHMMPDPAPRRSRWTRACRRSKPDEEDAAPKNPYV